MPLRLRTALILIVLSALMGGLLAACALDAGAPVAGAPTAAPTLATGAPATAQPATATPIPTVATPAPAITTAPTTPASPTVPASASQAVDLLLTRAAADFSLQSALPYLGPDLRARLQAGQLDAGSLLIMQNPFTSYAIDSEYADTQGNVYVDARLFFGGDTASGFGRIFRLSSAEGSWKVEGVTDAAVIPPPPPPWPGPGWALAAEGDLTGDGVSESVYCAPSGVTPVDGFGDAQLDSISTVCAEVMISSPPATPGGDHTIQLRATLKDLVAAGGILGSFASQEKPDGAAAHRLAVVPGAKVSVNILPLNPDGTAYAQGVGVYWNAAEGAFRFAGPDIWGTQ